jgi:hypothetical protein
LGFALIVLAARFSHAGEPKYWPDWCVGKGIECNIDEIRAWFPTVMQPGWEAHPNQGRSCCGEADAYPITILAYDTVAGTVTIRVEEGGAPYIPAGTVITAPADKVQNKYGNPVDHEIAFIGGGGSVYCIIPSGGV